MTESTKALDALTGCINAGHQACLAAARKALEHDRARPRRWELRISPQKIDIIDKTDIINVTKADDHVDPIDKTDAVNVNKPPILSIPTVLSIFCSHILSPSRTSCPWATVTPLSGQRSGNSMER